jgi:hypothetical protein
MNNIFVAIIFVTLLGSVAIDSGVTEDAVPWYENEQAVPYPDNTKALDHSTDNSVDILGNASNDKLQALQGEIMLKLRDDITQIYSNGNLVEQIVKGVGSTGVITSIESNGLKFTPTGRPELTCVARENGWFGPCRVEQNSDQG